MSSTSTECTMPDYEGTSTGAFELSPMEDNFRTSVTVLPSLSEDNFYVRLSSIWRSCLESFLQELQRGSRPEFVGFSNVIPRQYIKTYANICRLTDHEKSGGDSSKKQKTLHLGGTDNLVGADMFKGDSMCQWLEEADGNEAYGWLKEMESEDEGSESHESQTEVTENSPSHETNSHFAGSKRSSDDIIAKLAPFIKQQIEDALNSTILPLVSVLRSREEEEQKHREQMLALEKGKLAIKREKLLFKRRRVARSQPAPPRAPFPARSGNIRQLRLRVASPAI